MQAPHKSEYTYNHDLSALDHSQLIVFPAKRDIAFVAAELNLFALCDHLTVQQPCIEMRSFAAPAYRPNLLNIICKLHEPLCAGEKMTLEVRPQTVADDGDVMLIDKITEPVNDLRGKELHLVNDNAVVMLTAIVFEEVYYLCASAYTAYDLSKRLLFNDRCYKWGYFPMVIKYNNIYEVLKLKNSKVISILFVSRMIAWKHPEIPVIIAKMLKQEGISFHITMIGIHVLNTIYKKANSKTAYILDRLIVPMDVVKESFPTFYKYPILLPLFPAYRFLRNFKINKSRYLLELKTLINL